VDKKDRHIIDLTGQKGTLGDRCLKVLAQSGDEVTVKLFEGEELAGTIKGVGTYTILIQGAQGDILVFKHAIKTIWRAKLKGRWEKAKERIEESKGKVAAK